jgi:hypothetical protein
MLDGHGHVLVHEPESPVEPADQQPRHRPVAAAYRVGADGRRKATKAPPPKKAAATMHPARTQRWVGWSIMGRPCQLSSIIMVGTETARTSSADPTMSAQPGDRGARM